MFSRNTSRIVKKNKNKRTKPAHFWRSVRSCLKLSFVLSASHPSLRRLPLRLTLRRLPTPATLRRLPTRLTLRRRLVVLLHRLKLPNPEGKIPPDEPAVLPPLPLIPKSERHRSLYGTPQSQSFKRPDYRGDWDRERDRDFELMPPPGSHRRDFAAPDVDQPIDPDEPTYCVCHQVSFGDMIACDNENCQGGEWFHYSCVGLTLETRFKGKWCCPTCRQLPQ